MDSLDNLFGAAGPFSDDEATRRAVLGLGMAFRTITVFIEAVSDLTYAEIHGSTGWAEFERNPETCRWSAIR